MSKKKIKKRRPSDCKNCSGKYKLSHEDNTPIFICNKCGDRELSWNKFYKDYLYLYRDKVNWDNKKHHVVCVLGFFMHMYNKFYNTSYVLMPKNPNVFGSKEIKDSWELLSAFNGNAHNVRRYIYWLFEKELRSSTTITHFGYINTLGLIRKYNIYASRKHILRRESKLPNKFIDWCRGNEPTIFDDYNLETMNDLGALLGYTLGLDNSHTKENNVIKYAENAGLIKNKKINIG